MKRFDQLVKHDFENAFKAQFKNKKLNEIIKSKSAQIEQFMRDNFLSKKWLSGSTQPMAIDIHCYIVLERLVLLENSPWNHGFYDIDIKNSMPNVYNYVHRFRNYRLLKHNCFQFDTWCDHLTL